MLPNGERFGEGSPFGSTGLRMAHLFERRSRGPRDTIAQTLRLFVSETLLCITSAGDECATQLLGDLVEFLRRHLCQKTSMVLSRRVSGRLSRYANQARFIQKCSARRPPPRSSTRCGLCKCFALRKIHVAPTNHLRLAKCLFFSLFVSCDSREPFFIFGYLTFA